MPVESVNFQNARPSQASVYYYLRWEHKIQPMPIHQQSRWGCRFLRGQRYRSVTSATSRWNAPGLDYPEALLQELDSRN
jgi:hypothetical protein